LQKPELIYKTVLNNASNIPLLTTTSPISHNATHSAKKKNKRKTPYLTQELISANSGAHSQRCPGRAKGCQGYRTTDCKELNNAVKAFLPLGSQEWDCVHEQYKSYAKENGCDYRELNSLKIKFQALVNFSKPTGNPKCPETVCEAKRIQKATDARAHVMDCNDVEQDDGDSDE
jgi:hypothetical protein